MLAVRVGLAATVLGLAAVGVAAAANSFSFGDASGDAGAGLNAAPDIAAVDVSNDDTGRLTVRVTLANRTKAIDANGIVELFFDVDQNPDTGSVFYGADLGLLLKGPVVDLVRPDSDNRFMSLAGSAPASFQGGFNAGVETFSVDAADLGISPTGGFNVFVVTENNFYGDTAPDIRSVNYQLVPGTQPPALGADTRPPYDEALAAHGRRGHIVPLQLLSADGSGQSADTFRVYRGSRVIAARRFALEDKNPFYIYYFPWHAPRHIKGPLKFCGSSTDAAGNKSNVACALIVLR